MWTLDARAATHLTRHSTRSQSENTQRDGDRLSPTMVYFMEEPPGLTGVCIASVAFIAACLFLFRNKGNLDNVTTDTASSTSSATGTAGKTIAKDQLLRSVFSVKQTPSTVTGNGYGASSTSTTGGRPFESSYYFAHNGQSTG